MKTKSLIITTSVAFLFWVFCLNHVSINEIGISYNSFDGLISSQHPGWHLTSPLSRSTTISTLPFRIDLNPGELNRRVLNVKLVRFVPEFTDEFIKINGFNWIVSMEGTFKQYAFSGRDFKFLEVIDGEKK